MKKLLLIFIIVFVPGFVFAQSNHFVFLFDNSGSMQGFYREEISAFKPFCRALMKNSKFIPGAGKFVVWSSLAGKLDCGELRDPGPKE